MSESDAAAPRRAGRRVLRLVLRREDHIGDALGLAFLEAPETAGDAILERVRAYLGGRLRILKAEVSRARIDVEIEAGGWPEEAARLAAAARDLSNKGARRNAEAMFREALAIDPLNPAAMAGLGVALAAQNRDLEALDALRRAREFGADDAEVLLAMAACAARMGRRSATLAYLEQALEIDPKNFAARRSLKALGRTPKPPPSPESAPHNKRK